ncbi:MAG: hypothetical protein KF902_09320 [Phycisphaeraceae bacterium]|nr:hypothetical protein [Phycisphaeraceae bacterium]
MAEVCGRIWFEGNPWPRGHAIKEFAWSGRLDADGSLRFDLHLETVDYESEAEPEFDHEDDWRSAVVWSNYHRCGLSSTQWECEGATGLFLGDAKHPISWPDLMQRTLRADKAKAGDIISWEPPPAFYTYLLGHDAVADHRVRFTWKPRAKRADIEWSGRIALAYCGDFELKHRFRAAIRDATFNGFRVAPDVGKQQAERLFEVACCNAEKFRLVRRGGGLWFV